MFIAQIFYTIGNDELFGPFPTFEEARSFAQGLKYRPASIVTSYNVRAVNRV